MKRSMDDERRERTCPACKGAGVIVKSRGDEHIQRKCVVCRGTGRCSGRIQRK